MRGACAVSSSGLSCAGLQAQQEQQHAAVYKENTQANCFWPMADFQQALWTSLRQSYPKTFTEDYFGYNPKDMSCLKDDRCALDRMLSSLLNGGPGPTSPFACAILLAEVWCLMCQSCLGPINVETCVPLLFHLMRSARQGHFHQTCVLAKGESIGDARSVRAAYSGNGQSATCMRRALL